MFEVNQLVKGKVCGFFVILGFRKIDNEEYAQLKPICASSGAPLNGEIALPLTSIERV